MPVSPWSYAINDSDKQAIVDGHTLIAYALNVPRGTKMEPSLGWKSLSDLNVVTFPEPRELLEFEEDLLDHIVTKAVERSRMRALHWLKQRFGLTNEETVGVMKLADGLTSKAMQQSREEMRAMMVHRLEDLAERAHEALDTKTELQILRQIAKVQGLEGGMADEMVDLRMLAMAPLSNNENIDKGEKYAEDQ